MVLSPFAIGMHCGRWGIGGVWAQFQLEKGKHPDSMTPLFFLPKSLLFSIAQWQSSDLRGLPKVVSQSRSQRQQKLWPSAEDWTKAKAEAFRILKPCLVLEVLHFIMQLKTVTSELMNYSKKNTLILVHCDN